jgi:hypothetical protein
MSSQTLVVNLASESLAQAIVADYDNLIPAAVPDIALGDQVEYLIILADGEGAVDASSNSNTYSMKVAVGLPGQEPTSGTFTLTFGANTTAAIDYNASASAVSTALNAIASIISAGGVTVSGSAGGPWLVTFTTVGVRAMITATASNLYPATNAVISEVQTGSASVQEIQSIVLRRGPAAYQDTWAISGSGRTAFVNFATQGILDLLDSSEDEDEVEAIFEIELTDASTNRKTVCAQSVIVRRELIDATATVPTPTSDYYTAAEVDTIISALHARTAASVSTAGDTEITIAEFCKYHTVRVTAGAGVGTYTRNIDLDSTNRASGDKAEVVVLFAASTNPTIVVRDNGGPTTLYSETGSGVAYNRTLFFTWSGSAWESDQ